MASNRVLILLVHKIYDIVKITPKTKSNIIMAIEKYYREGVYDDILIAVAEELYQKTIIELDKVVDPSKVLTIENYYSDTIVMMQIAEKMQKTTEMSTKTAVCVKPMLLDIGMAKFANGDILNYAGRAMKIAEKHSVIVMATADTDLICTQTLRAADINTVRVRTQLGNYDYLTITMAEADYEYCDAGIYFWQPSVYIDAIDRVRKSKKDHETMVELASSLADLGTPISTPCCLYNWRPIIEYYWPAPHF